MQLTYPFQGDRRVALARQAIVDHPDATDEELISLLRAGTTTAHPYASWKLILASAREHAED